MAREAAGSLLEVREYLPLYHVLKPSSHYGSTWTCTNNITGAGPYAESTPFCAQSALSCQLISPPGGAICSNRTPTLHQHMWQGGALHMSTLTSNSLWCLRHRPAPAECVFCQHKSWIRLGSKAPIQRIDNCLPLILFCKFISQASKMESWI